MAKREKRRTLPVPSCGQCAYRALTDSHPDGFIVIDREGAVRLSNPAASELLGVCLRSGLSVRDQAGEHAVLGELLRAPNGTRVIRVPLGGEKEARLLEARTAFMQWEGETGLLVCLHETPPAGASKGRRWSFLRSAYRGFWASFQQPRRAPLIQEVPIEEPLILPDPAPDRVTPDALHDLDQVLETLRKAGPPPKVDA